MSDSPENYMRPGATWWVSLRDCPNCGQMVMSNGTIRVCREYDEEDSNCEWWEKL